MDKDKKRKRASAGGKARDAVLTPAAKREIASTAAAARWERQRGLPKETHTGALKLGEGIPCSVLDNGMRVLSLNGLARAFGSNSKGARPTDNERSLLPPIISAANLGPFIKAPLRERLAGPVEFRGMHGGRVSHGYEAEILPQMCDVLLDARAAGVLRKSQLHIAAAAELMMRGFAHVGIVALIDEATGYQAERARDELHKILEQYISKELLPWTKKFPDEFFEQIYRVHGWKYQAGQTQRPGYVGLFINRFVYEQLPDGVLDELRRKNPPVNGHRRHKHFQLLSAHTGNPHLDRQIVATTTILKIADNKDDFKSKYRKAFPKRGNQEEFDFDTDDEPVTAAKADHLMVVTGGVRGLTLDALRRGLTTTLDLAEAVYGAQDEATLNKTRKFLARLKAEGIVESVGKGAPAKGLWRLVSDTDED